MKKKKEKKNILYPDDAKALCREHFRFYRQQQCELQTHQV